MSDFFSFLYNAQLVNKITVGELGTLFVLLATIVVVIIYTYLTYKLWREANFQSTLSISPYIIFQISDDDVLYVKNIGNSVAFNVIIDPFIFILIDRKIKKREVYTLKFEKINFIESKMSKKVMHDTILSGGSSSSNFSLVDHLNPKYQNKHNYLFTINYTNIIGKKYFTKFYAGKDGIRIEKICRATFSLEFMRLVKFIIIKLRIFIRY